MTALDLILGSNETFLLFMFALAIVFGILEITKIFRNRGVNFIIALAISFFAVTNSSFVAFIEPQFGNITIFFIFMFFIAFVLEIFGLRDIRQRRPEEGILIIGAILLMVFVFGFTHSNLIPELPFIGSGTNFIILLALVLILVIFWAAFKAGPTIAQTPGEK